jgi:starvation-inducible DNA-binding protein
MNNKLAKLLADTYALYLKTQNYHWHVKGPNFKSLHQMFEEQYQELAMAVDDIAERILTLGSNAPASFDQFNQLTTIKAGDSNATSDNMIKELHEDHQQILEDLQQVITEAQKKNDEGTVSLASERIAAHEKIRWMLRASRN